MKIPRRRKRKVISKPVVVENPVTPQSFRAKKDGVVASTKKWVRTQNAAIRVANKTANKTANTGTFSIFHRNR